MILFDGVQFKSPVWILLFSLGWTQSLICWWSYTFFVAVYMRIIRKILFLLLVLLIEKFDRFYHSINSMMINITHSDCLANSKNHSIPDNGIQDSQVYSSREGQNSKPNLFFIVNRTQSIPTTHPLLSSTMPFWIPTSLEHSFWHASWSFTLYLLLRKSNCISLSQEWLHQRYTTFARMWTVHKLANMKICKDPVLN